MSADLGTSTLWLMAGLGALHGVNPAMGWLFAVALGLQEQSGRAVAQALVPMALGHLLAVGSSVALTAVLGLVLPIAALRVAVAAVLVGLGGYGLFAHLHPRWVRMRVGFRDLVVWSWLVAMAHGAGIMVVPALLGGGVVAAEQHRSAHAHAPAALDPLSGTLAAGAHTLAYLCVAGFMAWLLYRWLGLRILRSAWINVDVAWALTLIVTGVITLLN
jgi:hypothetical protein